MKKRNIELDYVIKDFFDIFDIILHGMATDTERNNTKWGYFRGRLAGIESQHGILSYWLTDDEEKRYKNMINKGFTELKKYEE